MDKMPSKTLSFYFFKGKSVQIDPLGSFSAVKAETISA